MPADKRAPVQAGAVWRLTASLAEPTVARIMASRRQPLGTLGSMNSFESGPQQESSYASQYRSSLLPALRLASLAAGLDAAATASAADGPRSGRTHSMATIWAVIPWRRRQRPTTDPPTPPGPPRRPAAARCVRRPVAELAAGPGWDEGLVGRVGGPGNPPRTPRRDRRVRDRRRAGGEGAKAVATALFQVARQGLPLRNHDLPGRGRPGQRGPGRLDQVPAGQARRQPQTGPPRRETAHLRRHLVVHRCPSWGGGDE